MSSRAPMRAVSQTVRAYFAPVNRATNAPAVFDPAKDGGFSVDAPPAPWIPLGTIADFSRSALTEVAALATGFAAALSLTEAVVNKDILDENKFKDGLGKIIDGVVQCLNSSAWTKTQG